MSRSTTSKWMITCAELLQPIFNLICDHVFDTGCMYCDGTVSQVFKEADQPPGSKSFMWVLGSHAIQEKAVCFFNRVQSQRRDLKQKVRSAFFSLVMPDEYHRAPEHSTRLSAELRQINIFVKIPDFKGRQDPRSRP